MFQFPGLARSYYRISYEMGCPIRISTDQRLFAPPRGFSQLITSFVASESQGIHRSPFFAFLCSELYFQLLLYSLFWFIITSVKLFTLRKKSTLFFVQHVNDRVPLKEHCEGYGLEPLLWTAHFPAAPEEKGLGISSRGRDVMWLLPSCDVLIL